MDPPAVLWNLQVAARGTSRSPGWKAASTRSRRSTEAPFAIASVSSARAAQDQTCRVIKPAPLSEACALPRPLVNVSDEARPAAWRWSPGEQGWRSGHRGAPELPAQSAGGMAWKRGPGAGRCQRVRAVRAAILESGELPHVRHRTGAVLHGSRPDLFRKQLGSSAREGTDAAWRLPIPGGSPAPNNRRIR